MRGGGVNQNERDLLDSIYDLSIALRRCAGVHHPRVEIVLPPAEFFAVVRVLELRTQRKMPADPGGSSVTMQAPGGGTVVVRLRPDHRPAFSIDASTNPSFAARMRRRRDDPDG